MANFILLKHRQALIDAPGPYIPPRFRILLQSAVLRGKGNDWFIMDLSGSLLIWICLHSQREKGGGDMEDQGQD